MLNALLQEEILEVQEEQREGFKVNDIDSANWCFRKIRALQEKKNETNKLADEEAARIENWRKKENESAEISIAYFEFLLADYFRELRAKDPKAKVSTPYGKVTSRKSKKWNYISEEETMNYLASNGYEDLIRVKKEIDKTNLKKTFKDGLNTETGEVLPGVEVGEEESISIKVE